jgi:hypothetical protein
MRWAGEERVAYRVVVGNRKRRRLLGRPRHGWEENNKLDFQEVGGKRGLD